MIRATSSVSFLGRNSAFLLSCIALALLGVASAAHADTMTYTILSNPQPDVNNGFVDNLSGTITVSNPTGPAIGTFDSTNDAGVDLITDFTMTSSDPAVTPVTVIGDVPLATAFNIVTNSQLFATPTSLSVGLDTYVSLDTGGGNLGVPYVQILYDTHDAPGSYFGSAGVQGPPQTMQFENHDADAFIVGGEWEIAAVPEPTTLALAASAILGLALVGLRRRRALVVQ